MEKGKKKVDRNVSTDRFVSSKDTFRKIEIPKQTWAVYRAISTNYLYYVQRK